jgi:hypothetical protein
MLFVIFFSPDIFVKRETGLCRILFLAKQDVQSALDDFFDRLVIVYLVIGSTPDRIDQTFLTHFLFHRKNAQATPVSLFRVELLLQDSSNIGLYVRIDPGCPFNESLRRPFRNKAMGRGHMIIYCGVAKLF